MPSSSRGSHYQRFIPREEVQEVAAWQFGPIDGPAQRHTTPEAQAQEDLHAAQQAQALHQQAWDEGFEAGQLEGAARTQLELQQQHQQAQREQAERVTAWLRQAQANFDLLEQALAEQVLQLACELARQVVRRELSTPLPPLRSVVQEALALLIDDGRPATLRLHPVDAALLGEPAALETHGRPVQVQPDPTLSPGDCVVECAHGGVDARLEKRWQRAVANLGLEPPWQPGGQADV
ncbi:MAG: flagellar assembly protein FliH [Serpentinimonas sp.]|nr:flagellar assembly protein FliH [Serpentinimonas sp.]